VKKRLTIALAATALAATVTSLTAAGLYRREHVTAADALPAYEILNSVRAFGLRPTTQALRRGPYYVLHAVDARGLEVRVVADAQLGDIVSIVPIAAPRYDSGPRIIQVPQPGERDDRASSYDGDAAVSGDNDDTEQAPPRPLPRRRIAPRPQYRGDLPPPSPRARPEPKPPGPPRNVLSAPPPPAGNSLSPIYPTPKFRAKPEPAEKFAPPIEGADNRPRGSAPRAQD
jgi:hypothetical protein